MTIDKLYFVEYFFSNISLTLSKAIQIYIENKRNLYGTN